MCWARALAERMRSHLGQPVIVENRPGANTALAAKIVSSAEPDGYTVLFATGATAVLNPLLYPKLTYNPEKELAPVARIALTPMIMVVGRHSPRNTKRDLITAARGAPAKLNYGSTGTGSCAAPGWRVAAAGSRHLDAARALRTAVRQFTRH